MKKVTALVLGALMSVSVLAAPTGKSFTGGSVGVEVGTTKYKVKDSGLSGKSTKDLTLTGGYAFEYGDSQLIGEVGAKAKLPASKAFTYNENGEERKVKEQQRLSVGYSQGYRVTNDLMPYAKVDYIHSRFKDDSKLSANGVGVGVGAKYQVAPNVEVGAEYMHSRLRSKKDSDGDRVKIRGNSVSTGVAYRF
ncbi:porin family protein [Conchiformibius steedae DSM 2580]|uniref:Porin family protein n=1 Tax=Conchiformibius steedae DSM 2580 TaxID=1121352 RepID=A0AAE9HXZ4_9NEIS|nr:porin family protein [Conchiformibius steedae]QMT33873.1 porin family protein [Conchiformibius steedae]URD68535.1 porin family protein [Conchiformibius steedae DSM 2580]